MAEACETPDWLTQGKGDYNESLSACLCDDGYSNLDLFYISNSCHVNLNAQFILSMVVIAVAGISLVVLSVATYKVLNTIKLNKRVARMANLASPNQMPHSIMGTGSASESSNKSREETFAGKVENRVGTNLETIQKVLRGFVGFMISAALVLAVQLVYLTPLQSSWNVVWGLSFAYLGAFWFGAWQCLYTRSSAFPDAIKLSRKLNMSSLLERHPNMIPIAIVAQTVLYCGLCFAFAFVALVPSVENRQTYFVIINILSTLGYYVTILATGYVLTQVFLEASRRPDEHSIKPSKLKTVTYMLRLGKYGTSILVIILLLPSIGMISHVFLFMSVFQLSGMLGALFAVYIFV